MRRVSNVDLVDDLDLDSLLVDLDRNTLDRPVVSIVDRFEVRTALAAIPTISPMPKDSRPLAKTTRVSSSESSRERSE